jgi:hypothetical protein
LDFKKAAFEILKQKGKPLTVKEITESALKQNFIYNSGKTPGATMGATLYNDIKNDKSVFVKTQKGCFGLKEWDYSNIMNNNKQPFTLIVEDIVKSLERNQFMSESPTKFEEAIKDAFVFLGFEGELIGGKGDTDVLLTANIGHESFKVNIDGKTSKSKIIPCTQIDFLALKDHKTKNDVDFVVVVGPNFSGGNLEKRANDYNVSLLKTDGLIKLIFAHAKFPFTLLELKDLFAECGSIDSQLEDLLSQNNYRRNMLEQFRIIIEEMQLLQDRLGYFTFDSLAGREKLEDIDIDPEDIEYLINLLKLPFINGVKETDGKKYILTIRIIDIANIFGQISLLLNPTKNIIDQSEIIHKTENLKPLFSDSKIGTKYFKWNIKVNSIVASARKDNAYEHYCPISHFIIILESIIKGFEKQSILSNDVVFSMLTGANLTPNRPFKGKAEEYKIRMAFGILELEGLLKWTGSKRPIEYILNVPLDEFRNWLLIKIKNEFANK